MNAKDEAAPHTRLSMEDRWRNARQSCDDGVCDETQQRWHKAGCERRKAKVSGTAEAEFPEAVQQEREELLGRLADGMDVPADVRDLPSVGNVHEVLAPLYEEGTSSGIKYGGWCVPSEVLYPDLSIPLMEEFPMVTVERGGIFFPPVTLHHDIMPVRAHWWSREWFEVWTRPQGSASPAIYMGQFRTREDARQQCIDLDKLNYEIERRRRQIENAR